MKIQIINVGLGNVASIQNMLRKIGYTATLSEVPDLQEMPDLIILPGVGAYDAGMAMLEKFGWISYLKDVSVEGTVSILGICLGMQLLCNGSDEGVRSGLGLISGHFKRFNFDNPSLKVPHMGWNTVELTEVGRSLFPISELTPRFYFVHSYYYYGPHNDFVTGWSNYGHRFGAVIHNQLVTGVQFHPEKSHRFGMQFLQTYIKSRCSNIE
jgi:glutamine amidotransferase